jgi:DNA-binding cell septation regulator SpoVG
VWPKVSCSRCGKPFHLIGSFEHDPEGALLHGEPVCFDCWDSSITQAKYKGANMSVLVNVRISQDTGTLKAYADVQVHFSASVLSIHGLRVIESDPSKGPWVAYPQQAGKKEGKWYDIVKATGKLHDAIASAVLKEYSNVQAKGTNQAKSSAVPRAQIPPEVREPGEDEAPF